MQLVNYPPRSLLAISSLFSDILSSPVHPLLKHATTLLFSIFEAYTNPHIGEEKTRNSVNLICCQLPAEHTDYAILQLKMNRAHGKCENLEQ